MEANSMISVRLDFRFLMRLGVASLMRDGETFTDEEWDLIADIFTHI